MDSHGNPTRIELTEGQSHDLKPASKLLEDCRSTTFLADKGYDFDALIEQLEGQGCTVIIPPKRNRKVRRSYDRDTYKSRFLVERRFRLGNQETRKETEFGLPPAMTTLRDQDDPECSA